MKKLRDLVLTVTPEGFEKPDFVSGGSVSRTSNYRLRSQATLVEALDRKI